jgi:uncharacterized protein YjgD (DUF1641 family)
LPKRDPREELLSRLEKAPAEHAEAILAGFEVLQALHDRGVLELLRGVLDGGNKTLEIVVQAANSPEAIRGIRNLLIMTKVVGSIDPEVLKKFAVAVPDAIVGAATAQEKEPPAFWEVLRILSGGNLRRGLALMNNVLEACGKSFSIKKARAPGA